MNNSGVNYQVKQPSHGASNSRENCGLSVSTSIATVKRRNCQLASLDISLLPPWELMGSFSYQNKGQPASSPRQSPKLGAEQPPCAHLTIFYAGKVNVYNVSADKAKAIMAAASRISGLPGSGDPSSPASTPSTPLNSAPCCMDMTPITPSPSAVAVLSRTQALETIKAEELPITRQFSILRFLEKRNDRIHRSGPYARLGRK